MLRQSIRFTSLLLAALLGGCTQLPVNTEGGKIATSDDGTIHEYRLDNGMQLIVKEDHRAPVVISQLWYKVGASYEHIGITGVSHVLEHMMFKGTEKHPAGEFSRIIAENGGSENAFTGRDYTSYFQQLEKSRLPIAFELEADRMRNLQLPQEEFLKEAKVVMEERRLRTEDKPTALTYEKFMATAFQVNPYHNPVIGWMDDLKNLTVEDLQQWYRTWYAPNNATLVVAGDVDPDAVSALAQKHFGDIEPSVLPPQKPRSEPEQHGERRITVRQPAELPMLLMGYKTPTLRTAEAPWKAYAMEVLVNILDGDDSARITRELVRGEELAASAGAGYDLQARHDTLLLLQGTPAQGRNIDELEAALRLQIDRLQNELVSREELARIKAQVTAAKVYELDSIFYQAMQLGMLETVGLDWREAERYVERINAVTPEQVRIVAREFLRPERLTVATLDPLPLEDNTSAMEVDHAAR
ncbi:MAG: insulinase family protein [Gammaproteobacteria bacterium]|nr:insulinase family protein [Gammaproteobacteria bacterium]